MSKKAEERAFEAYPMKDYNKEPNYIHSCDSKMLDMVKRLEMNKKMLEMSGKTPNYLDTVVDHIMDQVRKLPELPQGWVYEFSFDEVYNYEIKGWEYKIIAVPVQQYKIP